MLESFSLVILNTMCLQTKPIRENPWYATNKVELANNHVAGYAITTYLTSTSDPRISYNFAKAANSGSYAGEPSWLKTGSC